MYFSLRPSALLLPILLLPGLLHALPEDRNKPIQLEADRGQLDQRTGTSIYEGNVVIIQGSMHLNADTATVYTQNGQFQRIEASGKPATWRYKVAADKEELHGTGQRVDYDVTKDLMTMSGNARVTQGEDVFTGDYIEYDTKTDMIRARGEKGNRIQITIQPKSPVTGASSPGSSKAPAPPPKAPGTSGAGVGKPESSKAPPPAATPPSPAR